MLKRSVAFLVGVIIFLNVNILYSGNHEVIHPTEGFSIGWSYSNAIPYWVDRGPLGMLSNLQAQALMESMMRVWADVETAEVGFSYQGSLPHDVDDTNILDYINMTSCGRSTNTEIPENVVPIIFDNDGKILERLAGLGSSGELGGLATLRCFEGSNASPRSIYQGMIIINGQFIDGKGDAEGSPKDLGINNLGGVMLHEVGHLLGLDHAVVNDEIFDGITEGVRPPDDSRFLPVMLPTVLRKSTSSTTLHPDDIAAISTLYPAEGHLSEVGKIQGEITDKRGEEIRKVNIIARNFDDPLCEAFSAVSGRRCVPLVDSDGEPDFNSSNCNDPNLFGDYVIEGLPPGDYTVEIEELASGWIRGGMYPPSVDEDLPGDAEFYNERDAVKEDPYQFDTVWVSGGEVLDQIDIVLNGSEAGEGTIDRMPLRIFDPGPATRCLADQVDYVAFLNEVDEDYVLPSLSEFNIGDPTVAGSGAGCRLIPGAGFNGASMTWFLLFSLIRILRGVICRRR